MKSKQEIKTYFENGDIPNQEQFWEWQDSYWHKEEQISSDNIDIDLSHKADLVGGKVPASQLPSYVDDVLEFGSFTDLPPQGESGIIYITTDNNKLYRWTGTRYIDITQGDVGTLQTVTERGNSTDKSINLQGIPFGGSSSMENILIGGDISTINQQSNYTISIGKNSNPSGTDNVVLGYSSIIQNDSSSIGNVVVGNYAMQQALGASENVVVGYNAFVNATNSYGNTIVGTYAGSGYGSGTNLNIILGCNSGGLASNSSNNTIIGNHNLFGNTLLQNKLFIGNNSGGLLSVSQGLISGDFVDRYVNINGKLSVTPGQMPSSDSSYTKNLVAKPDGTFGWENKTEALPLSGTSINKPLTGAIEYTGNDTTGTNSFGFYSKLPNEKSGFDIQNDGTLTPTMYLIGDNARTELYLSSDHIGIGSSKPNFSGLKGNIYYGDYYQDESYVQKKYVDKKLSYSPAEVKTSGKWINGKPIYRKTVVYSNIPSDGEIDISTDFNNMETIVSNQMFTDWQVMDTAFAGNQWKAETFITLAINAVKIHSIKIPDYDFSLLDSFTLTLEYTKTTD